MNYMYINEFGDWACQYCCTSALMFESVRHFPNCPVIKEHYYAHKEQVKKYQKRKRLMRAHKKKGFFHG